jgi:hypothetical protein
MNDFPPFLYRFFDNKQYALEFIQGKIYLGSLAYYSKIEDEMRRDETENISLGNWKNTNITWRIGSINERFVLCTSGPGVDIEKMKIKFKSQYVVKICNPLDLFNSISTVWKDHTLSINDKKYEAELVKVIYEKGETQELHPYLIAPPGYTQKPTRFADEIEFRFVLTCNLDEPRVLDDHLLLNIQPTELSLL